MRKIDHNNPTPLYEQLKSIIRDEIMNGEYPFGSHLPSESMLCEKFGVSRITVVRALNDLESASVLQRVQGSGTIVRFPQYRDTLNNIQGFTKTVRSAGNEPRSRILAIESVKPNEMLLKTFHLSEGEEGVFIKFRRLRYVNDSPAAIMTSFVRGWLGKEMQKYDLETASFYTLYQEITHSPLIRNETTLSPILATPEIVDLLNVKLGSPHFLFTGISYLEGNIPVEYNISVFHGSIFQFTTNIYKVREANDTYKDIPNNLL